ncbi:MAG: hypothetical protein JO359_01735 [Candidatus Eremiobacteraeota bacterium]|nr:hypothetical protein [Candidatus Eremiobacteraeota bacterium]
MRIFPRGFYDPDYVGLERDYKWAAHKAWTQALAREHFRAMLEQNEFARIADHAVRIESRTNLLFSFEKMALRDAVKSRAGARAFAVGLFELLHGAGAADARFEAWCNVVAGLPRKQTRVLTWPVVTVFGFIAQPEKHIFLKPNVTRLAARAYGFDFRYESRPSWDVYENYLAFAAHVRRDLKDLRPRDQIDIQSFLWIQGSDEYEE